ncbi:uncharacterized protein [Channa argus]|uniref:uncharacterized protein isoform X2 n=1 Tax=Channa argus TaxID=215402 RepID=UPI00351FB3CA
MMVGFRQIQKSLCLMLMLQFTVSGEFSSFIVVRDGDDVTLPCDNVRDDQDKCDRTTWFFNVVTLFEHGKIKTGSNSKSRRLSLTENCSLVIKKVTDEDAGRYSCRQTKPEQQQQDSFVHLSVVSTSTGSYYSSVTVRKGDDAILPCENVIDNYNKCHSTTFLFSSRNSGTVELITHGQINEKFKSKSDSLNVTENCSLVIKKVTDEDVGRYNCRQYKSGRQQGSESVVDVSVVTMTEHKDNNKVTLNCSVSKHRDCGHTVKLLFDGNKNDFTDLKTSQHFCSVTATFTSHLNQKTCSESLKCEVTDAKSKKVHQLLFRPQCSGEDAKITTTKSTITETTVTATTKKTTTNKRNPTKAEGEDAATTRKSSTMESTTMMANNLTPTNSSQTNISDSKTNQVWLLWIVIVTVSLAVLLITVVVWKKTKGKKTPKDENLTDPEDGVCYASISYSKKKKSKAQSRGNNDEGDTVTYSTVKASSSSGGVSTDPTVTYAAINKPKK